MPLDGLFLNKLLTELSPILTRAKINKVYQPDKHTITLKINQYPGGNHSLVLSAHPINARINLTATAKDNPTTPPPFVMVLRKHIEGGRILSIQQKGLDRVAELTIEGRNEIGETAIKKLFLEIMGKHSNIILTEENMEIIGAIKQYGSNISRYREVLPHYGYIPPPAQDKINPLLITEEELQERILNHSINLTLVKALTKEVEGISPQTALEIAYRCMLEQAEVASMGAYEFQKVYETLKKLAETEAQGTISLINNKAKDFYYLPLSHYEGETLKYDSLSQTLEAYFDKREREAVFTSRKDAYLKTLYQALEKLKRKIKKQEQELADALSGEKYKLYAQLLTAYLYQIPNHADKITLPNFYDDEKPITISLKPELSPSDNAARYFRRYNKTKTARDAIQCHLSENRAELTYLENLCYSLETADNSKDLEIVREEAISAGYLKDRNNPKGKRRKIADALPPREIVYQDYKILIGRNNKQNDKLTLKIADKDDIWLHTKDIPGSHVIIKCHGGKEIPPEVITKGAALAGYFSKAKEADKVPVDFTKVKHVKKPNGAKPGMVIYFEQTTIYVKPEGFIEE